MASTLKTARVLSPIKVNDMDFAPNSLITGTVEQIKQLGDTVDSSKAAVSYCLEKLKSEPVNIVPEEKDEESKKDDSGNEGDGNGSNE